MSGFESSPKDDDDEEDEVEVAQTATTPGSVETSPLLSSHSTNPTYASTSVSSAHPPPVLPSPNLQTVNRSSFRSRLPYIWTVLAVMFYLSFTAIMSSSLFTLLLASSFRPALSDKETLQNSVVVSGPRDIKLLNVSQDGTMWFEMEIGLGVDTDRALGFNHHDERGIWWERTRRTWARRAVDSINKVSVALTSPIRIQTADHHPLVTVTPDPTPLLVPLTSSLQKSAESSSNLSGQQPKYPKWLTTFTVRSAVSMDASPEVLLSFLKQTWNDKKVDIVARLPDDAVTIAGVGDWLGRFTITPDLVKEGMDVMNVSMPLPPIRNLPSPLPENLTDLIHMEDYVVYPSNESTSRLLLDAGSTIPNVFTDITAYFPFRFAFSAGVVLPNNELPDNVIAHVRSLPVEINPSFRRIAMNASGEIVADPKPADGSPSALSRFIQAYLINEPYSLLLRPLRSPGVPKPIWDVVAALPPLVMPIPKMDEPLKLMRSVRIEGMKINPTGKIVLATGTVKTEIFVPGVLGDVDDGLDVQGVLPEVLIFNGPVPDDDDDDDDDNAQAFSTWGADKYIRSDQARTLAGDRPLPDPLPKGVFGRLLPDDHLPSTSEKHPTEPRVLIVTSPFKDAPVEILDSAQLRSFVAKLIFKGGALAGVKGTCDCRTLIKGLGSDVVEINGIPFQGEVYMGRH
ncbi:hypothetical protein [Phaffia rhodozyma]|uniref:Uncharacterized protein n=1 Tax=Phaffia rhodozyma TaxID=264483 RepID=A0A0F7SQD0_PHARH|nr:hypothetical protein [Phaffia rhodozyma]